MNNFSFGSLKFKDKIFIAIVLIGLILVVAQRMVPGANKNGNVVQITINKNDLNVWVSRTSEERFRGLSGKESMGNDRGMIFFHEKAGKHTYVMRDMKFDLDFIFIKNDEIVDIAKNVAFEYQGVVKGGTDYDKVLEVNANWAKKNGIEIGNKVIIEE